MMKLLAILIFTLVVEVAGLAQTLPFAYGGVLPGRTNLDVRWKASKHPWPKTLWTYQMVPTTLSPSLISNLVQLGGFTEKDRYGVTTTNGFAYYNYKNRLSVSFATGEIDFDRELARYGPTNLAHDVPGTNQLYSLTTNFLTTFGVDTSEIPKDKRDRLKIQCSEPSHTQYFLGETTITNVQFRRASFGRLIDGVMCDPMVGKCAIDYGEHNQIKAFSLSWRNLTRDRLCSAATPDQIVRWIHEGKMLLPKEIYVGDGETAPIDWSAAKKITIEDATAHYWGDVFIGDRASQPIFPSAVAPYGMLAATVDMGGSKMKLRIVCPVIDDSKPMN